MGVFSAVFQRSAPRRQVDWLRNLRSGEPQGGHDDRAGEFCDLGAVAADIHE